MSVGLSKFGPFNTGRMSTQTASCSAATSQRASCCIAVITAPWFGPKLAPKSLMRPGSERASLEVVTIRIAVGRSARNDSISVRYRAKVVSPALCDVTEAVEVVADSTRAIEVRVKGRFEVVRTSADHDDVR